MNDSVFEAVETSSRILRLDFSSIGFAKLAEEQDFSEEQIQAVGVVFKHLQNKKVNVNRIVIAFFILFSFYYFIFGAVL